MFFIIDLDSEVTSTMIMPSKEDLTNADNNGFVVINSDNNTQYICGNWKPIDDYTGIEQEEEEIEIEEEEDEIN